MRSVLHLYSKTLVADFGSGELRAVRQRMIDDDLCRNVINSRVNRIRRMFKWGVERELVPPAVLHALQAVAPFKRGRSAARETEPVGPAPHDVIDEVLRVAPRQISAMIRLQRLAGMRPGEVVTIRTGTWTESARFGHTNRVRKRPSTMDERASSTWGRRPSA